MHGYIPTKGELYSFDFISFECILLNPRGAQKKIVLSEALSFCAEGSAICVLYIKLFLRMILSLLALSGRFLSFCLLQLLYVVFQSFFLPLVLFNILLIKAHFSICSHRQNSCASSAITSLNIINWFVKREFKLSGK